MFDVDLAGGESYRESRSYRPGELAVLHDLPWGRLGLTVCYDLRFPALYRALAEAGAIFLAIPSAFTRQTGEAHWHVLMRARAIENGCYVFAAAQGGKHENGRETFGHSLVVDPWGRIVAEGGTEPGVVMAEIDPAEVAAARARVPSLQHGRRFEVIEPMAEPTHLHAVRRSGMIRYSLICDKEHDFEIWFKNSADYDKQAKRGLVTCPACGSAKVEKALMAPSLGRGARKGAPRRCRRRTRHADAEAPPPAENKTPVAMVSPQEREFRAKLKELRDHLTKNADNVGAQVPRGSAQDALRRDRAPLDLRRGFAAGGQGTARGRHGIPPAAGAAGRAKLSFTAPRSAAATPSTISAMPSASRVVVACLKMKYEIACANSTSTSASVRTLATLVSAKARNQNSDAVAPMKPANSDGRQARTIARSTARSRSAR